MLNRWLQAPGVTSPEPETILRQILVQPLVLQQCIHFPEVAQLAADSLALCFRDLSHQLILPAHPVLGHVLVAPCKLKQVGAPSAPEKPASSEVAVTKGSSLPPVTARVRTHAACSHPHSSRLLCTACTAHIDCTCLDAAWCAVCMQTGAIHRHYSLKTGCFLCNAAFQPLVTDAISLTLNSCGNGNGVRCPKGTPGGKLTGYSCAGGEAH